MPNDNRISAVLAPADKTSILQKITEIRALLPFLLNLTVQERKELFKLGDKGLGFDDKCRTYMTNNPTLVPSYVTVAEVDKDRTLRTAADSPSRLTVSTTRLTKSGRERALPTSDCCARLTVARSVPALTSENALRTRTQPGASAGGGTSTNLISPVLKSWMSCFIAQAALWPEVPAQSRGTAPIERSCPR